MLGYHKDEPFNHHHRFHLVKFKCYNICLDPGGNSDPNPLSIKSHQAVLNLSTYCRNMLQPYYGNLKYTLNLLQPFNENSWKISSPQWSYFNNAAYFFNADYRANLSLVFLSVHVINFSSFYWRMLTDTERESLELEKLSSLFFSLACWSAKIQLLECQEEFVEYQEEKLNDCRLPRRYSCPWHHEMYS